MFSAIRQIFLKGGTISDAIAYVFKATGNMPTKSEGMKMINIYKDVQKNTGKVVEFPKDRITPFHKPRPGDVKKNVEEVYFDNPEDPRLFKPDTKKPLFKDSPEAIEKIKSNNKDAVKRLKEKKLKEDFEKAVKPKKDRMNIRLMKNWEKELTDIDLAQEGYNLQEIGILQKARNVMKKEGQNPDDALQWVKSEMADAEGVDIEDFMPDFDWGDFPGKRDFAEGGIAPLVGEPTYAANFYDDRTPYQGGGLAGGPPISSGNMNQAPNQIQSMSQGPGALIQPLQQPQPWMTGPQQQAMANAPPEGIAGMAGAQMASNPGPRTPMKEGGTSRRGFLKMMGGLAALPFIGKYLKGAKVAAPAVEKAVEAIKRTADGVPMYWNNLIEVIKAKGVKKIMDSDYSKFPDTQYTYKGVDVIEDATGDVTRVKKNIKWGDDNRMVNPEIEMSVTKGKTQVTDEGLGTQKSFREADEFEEVSVTPDMDGKMKDAEFYVDDSDHLQFEEIANELDMIRTKKASGGLASMLGE